MPAFSGTVRTQLGLGGWPTQPYGSFSGKSASATTVSSIAVTGTFSPSVSVTGTFVPSVSVTGTCDASISVTGQVD